MTNKFYLIVVALALASSFSACPEEEVAPKKEKVEYQNSPEYDGIPESDAHTNPEENFSSTIN